MKLLLYVTIKCSPVLERNGLDFMPTIKLIKQAIGTGFEILIQIYNKQKENG